MEGQKNRGGREEAMLIAALTALEFLCGSLMFSYWLGLTANKKLTDVGDGNPGGFNLMQSSGVKLGVLGMALDFLKGYLPLVLLIETGLIGGFGIVPVAVAPVFGHAFSPFTHWKGGKAIAVTFGIWSALTRFEASVAYALILALLAVLERVFNKGRIASSDFDGFAAVAGMLLLGAYLVFRGYSFVFFAVWGINLLLLFYTNRTKLHRFFSVVLAEKGKIS